MPKPYFRSSSDECDHQSIHGQTIVPFVFQEHTITTASMPKPYFRSSSDECDHQSIQAQTIDQFVLQEHTITTASMPKPYFRSSSDECDHQSIHGKTIDQFVFQEHTITRELPKPSADTASTGSRKQSQKGSWILAGSWLEDSDDESKLHAQKTLSFYRGGA